MKHGWILQSTGIPPIVLRMPPGSVRTIGRTARADFIVKAPLVSRIHCRLTAGADGTLTVQDLESTNGTHVNGEKAEKVTLQAGDVLKVGRVEFSVNTT